MLKKQNKLNFYFKNYILNQNLEHKLLAIQKKLIQDANNMLQLIEDVAMRAYTIQIKHP